jgi:lambda repressor-like predicted transcriptional regulator
MKEARDILAEALGTVAPQQMWPVRGVREVDDATFADSILAALSEKGWTLAPVEGLEELWALFDAADAEQAAEDKVRSRKGRFLPSFFDTTARHAFQEASVAHVRRALTTDTGRNPE